TDTPETAADPPDAPPVDVRSEAVRRAIDQHDVDEVVEQLEEADLACVRHLAVTARRRTEPRRQAVADAGTRHAPRNDLRLLWRGHISILVRRRERSLQPLTSSVLEVLR